ncbi:hypothetical protein ES695_11085 [Candidatus Atribacteria bacterium 1244-E10-H5-B2]|nr:MAG: hypothetical protein ES695_11085 [Candidatus Atribacteria bacterium 1244-E10-H5-B2]
MYPRYKCPVCRSIWRKREPLPVCPICREKLIKLDDGVDIKKIMEIIKGQAKGVRIKEDSKISEEKWDKAIEKAERFVEKNK